MSWIQHLIPSLFALLRHRAAIPALMRTLIFLLWRQLLSWLSPFKLLTVWRRSWPGRKG